MADIRQQLADVTIKAASTAAVATDLPLVVALHPSSPTPALTGSSNVSGSVAHNATTGTSGWLKAMGAWANAAAPTWTEGNIVALSVDLSGNLRVSDTKLPAAAAAADGTANPTVTLIEALSGLFNGTSWDRGTNNMLKVLTGDTGTKTTSFAGATQTNRSARGAIITARFGTVSGTTPTCTIQLQFSPDDGTTWINLGPSAAASATNNTVGIIVFPGATVGVVGFSSNALVSCPLPRTWRLNYTIAGTTPSFALTETDVNYCM